MAMKNPAMKAGSGEEGEDVVRHGFRFGFDWEPELGNVGVAHAGFVHGIRRNRDTEVLGDDFAVDV